MPAERDFIRREFCTHFSSYPVLADGIFLRTWRAGLQEGQSKIPKAMAGPRGCFRSDPKHVRHESKCSLTHLTSANLTKFNDPAKFLYVFAKAHKICFRSGNRNAETSTRG